MRHPTAAGEWPSCCCHDCRLTYCWLQVSLALREAIGLCDAWAATTALLTTIYWQGSWRGGRFADPVLARLQARQDEL